jgi:quinol monooxygenase YgiN
LHMQLRKIIKARGHFPSDEAATKLIYLALRNIAKRWKMPPIASHIRVFEIYRDAAAYKSHLESAHFKKYKATTEKMVKSLRLVQTTPIMLGANAR